MYVLVEAKKMGTGPLVEPRVGKTGDKEMIVLSQEFRYPVVTPTDEGATVFHRAEGLVLPGTYWHSIVGGNVTEMQAERDGHSFYSIAVAGEVQGAIGFGPIEIHIRTSETPIVLPLPATR